VGVIKNISIKINKMYIKKGGLLLVSFIYISNYLFGQTHIESIVSKEAQQYLTSKGTIGLSIGVIFNNQNFTYNFGLSKLLDTKPPTEHSIYSIGSISKTFVSTLLAKAVLEKKVNLQDDIRKYLPDSISFENLQFERNPIRLIHLCNHTSRIPSQLAKLPSDWNKFTPEEKYLLKKQYTKGLFLEDLRNVELDTIPGYKYQYSNAGFKLLSIILEKIYQMPYDKLIDKYFAGDLRMTTTKVYLDKDNWSEFASGGQNLNVLMTTKDIDDFTSGPVLNSTVNDMLKYLSSNISEKNKAIKITHKSTFINGEKVEIGLAWRIKYTPNGQKYFYHSGSGWGCNSICLFSPTKKLGLVVMANEITDQGKIFELGTNIMTQMLSEKN
jgi:serine-type D-Ala-D-Ala carboxypeptidase/endopeptidase